MTLVDNWKTILTQAHSIRAAQVIAVLATIQAAMLALSAVDLTPLPGGLWLQTGISVSIVITTAVLTVLRMVAQPGLAK